MNQNYFIYNGKQYFIGTIIEINTTYQSYCGFHSKLQFQGYNTIDNLYYFSSLYDSWEIYKFSYSQVSLYIEKILITESLRFNNKTTKSEYIDGIISAWIWYILIMIGALFFKGIGNILITWIFTSWIFFTWRYKKINGG